MDGYEQIFGTNDEEEIIQINEQMEKEKIVYQIQMSGNSALALLSPPTLRPDSFFKYRLYVKKSDADRALELLGIYDIPANQKGNIKEEDEYQQEEGNE